MRIFRHLLMVLAMLSVAALPGPSHAVSRHDDGDTHVAHQLHADRADRLGLQQATEASHAGNEQDCPDHDHGKCCVTACCAPTCLPLAELTSLAVSRWTFVLRVVQGDDLDRAGAVPGLPKRPPKPV